MKLTDALLGEHGMLYALFERIDELISSTDDIHEIRGALSILDAQLRSHAKIEEDLLFPRLEPYLGQMGPISVMLSEHRVIDHHMDAAKTATDLETLKRHIRGLLEVSRSHFQKEEMVLFAMARQFLDDDELAQLGDDWAATRKVTTDGQGCGGMAKASES